LSRFAVSILLAVFIACGEGTVRLCSKDRLTQCLTCSQKLMAVMLSLIRQCPECRINNHGGICRG